MAKATCHYTGHKAKCSRHECHLYQCITGTDPQSGKDVARWACADVHRNTLLLEIGRRLHQLDAEISALRRDVRHPVARIVIPGPHDVLPRPEDDVMQ